MLASVYGWVMNKLSEELYDLFKSQFRRQTGMVEKLEKLKSFRHDMQAAVSVCSQVEIEDQALNKWLWKLRDALDEADDVLDHFDGKYEEQVSTNNRKRTGCLFGTDSTFMKRLEEAVHKLNEISAQVSNFHNLLNSTWQAQQHQQLKLQKNRETGPLIKNHLVGRSKEMEFVRQWLRNPCSADITNSTTDLYSKISLLSIVGHGGMGKTTLLQHVFEDEMTEGFEVKIWACVSNNSDAKTVIRNMIEYIEKERPTSDTLAPLQDLLKSKVKDKKFLLVLDDIWEDDEKQWRDVLSPLFHESLGGKILITTRMNSVASMFSKMIKKSESTSLTLKGLEEEECLQLFNTYAFDDVENIDVHERLTSIAREIFKKLSGCPLAAKVIGKVLNSNLDVSYWTNILNTNIGNIAPDKNDLLSSLELSYIYLPDQILQSCFAYCSIFARDHKFDKDDLVRMWIALGFFKSLNNQRETIEDAGKYYFNKLFQRSFFDKVQTDNDRTYYKMDGLLHELAQSVSKRHFIRVVKDNELSISREIIRHLSINTRCSNSLELAFKNMGEVQFLQSLFLSIHERDDEKFKTALSKIFEASKSIRLLVISAPYLEKVPETIKHLIRLRYLKLDCENCSSSGLRIFSCDGVQLPRSISDLYHLQFLISKLQILEMDDMDWKACNWLVMDKLIIKDPSVLLREPLKSISSFRYLRIEENYELDSFPTATERWFQQDRLSLFELDLYNLQSLQRLPSSLLAISSLKTLKLQKIPHLESLPDLPPSLSRLHLIELENLARLPSCFPTTLLELHIIEVPRLEALPDLPASLTKPHIEDCHPQLMERHQSF